MSLIEEGMHPWVSGAMLIAGGVAALAAGDLPPKELGLVSIIAGPLFIVLHWKISKDLEEGGDSILDLGPENDR